MNNNIKCMVDDLANTNYNLGAISARVDALHKFVDTEDTRSAESNSMYHTPSIDTNAIRMIFGWDECYDAIKIRREREAREKEDAGADDRAEG